MHDAKLTKEPGVWTAQDLLENYNVLGIPHFQRGLVWKNDSISLLLESLYFGTHCGTIILWKPKEADRVSEFGQPLPSSTESPRYLIIDGQQRIRSLWDVIAKDKGENAETESDADDDSESQVDSSDNEEEDNRSRIWCLNLGRISELAGAFRGGKRFMLFRYAKDPSVENNKRYNLETDNDIGEKKRHSDPSKYDKEALFPLRLIAKKSEWAKIAGDNDDVLQKSVSAVLKSEAIKKGLERIKNQALFYVVVLKERDGYGLKEVVAVYNRINSAGMRVEKEEKAFANLVFVSPSTNKTLEEFFAAVHPSNVDQDGIDGNHEHKTGRDEYLRRQKENKFGFKLFMRTFVQSWAYHSNRSIGSTTFSFKSVTPEALDKVGNEKAINCLPPILEETKNVLICIRGILRDKLFCDDLRMLPETTALWPVIQLLIRYPSLREQTDIVASVVFRLMLGRIDMRPLLDLVGQVNASDNSLEALDVFVKSTVLAESVLEQEIEKQLKKATALNNRHTLMLYWLLRHQGAIDFDYSKNNLNIDGEAVHIDEVCRPSKQHIVPYSLLKDLYKNLKRRGRLTRHEANDIGNLTYISAKENGWKCLGSKPMNLKDEPSSNRTKHFLNADKIQRLFESVCDRNGNEKERREHYEEFCRIRRGEICKAFVRYWRELADAAVTGGTFAPTQPASRMIYGQEGERPARPESKPPITEPQFIQKCHRQGLSDDQQQSVDSILKFAKDYGLGPDFRPDRNSFAVKDHEQFFKVYTDGRLLMTFFRLSLGDSFPQLVLDLNKAFGKTRIAVTDRKRRGVGGNVGELFPKAENLRNFLAVWHTFATQRK